MGEPRDINDPTFFDSDNLASLEENAYEDPFASGWSGQSDEAAVDGGGEAGDADTLADVGGGEGAEDVVGGDVDAEGVDGEASGEGHDPAPHLNDLETLKKSIKRGYLVCSFSRFRNNVLFKSPINTKIYRAPKEAGNRIERLSPHYERGVLPLHHPAIWRVELFMSLVALKLYLH